MVIKGKSDKDKMIYILILLGEFKIWLDIVVIKNVEVLKLKFFVFWEIFIDNYLNVCMFNIKC